MVGSHCSEGSLACHNNIGTENQFLSSRGSRGFKYPTFRMQGECSIPNASQPKCKKRQQSQSVQDMVLE